MHEVKVALQYTLLVNRSASEIDCRSGQATCLKSIAYLNPKQQLKVPTRIRDETLDFRVLRRGDPFDGDHTLSIRYKDFEDNQVIYIRQGNEGKLFWDGNPRIQCRPIPGASRIFYLRWKAGFVREKHLLRNMKKIKNLTNTTVILSERVDPGVYTELVSIKPDKEGILRYDDTNTPDNTWYRIHVKGHAEEISREWTSSEFFADKEYISIVEMNSQPQSLDIQSRPRTFMRIINRATSIL